MVEGFVESFVAVGFVDFDRGANENFCAVTLECVDELSSLRSRASDYDGASCEGCLTELLLLKDSDSSNLTRPFSRSALGAICG